MSRWLAELDIAGVARWLHGVVGHSLRTGWRGVRTLTGEDAYERYVVHLRAMHSDREPMSHAAFYRQRELQKWDGIKRCC